MRARRIVALWGALLLAIFAVAAPAAAQTYPTPTASAVQGSATPSTVEPGGPATFSGSGFGDTVVLNLSINGKPAGTTTTDGSGNFSAQLTLNACGPNTLTATGPGAQGENRVATASVTVVCAATSTSPAPARAGGFLPRTGTEGTIAVLASGLVLITAGGAMVLYSRRARRSPISR